jgi:surfactin synthase thioesterase subunit
LELFQIVQQKVGAPLSDSDLHIHATSTSRAHLHEQDKPYAIFGTCLGAIVAYEVTRRVAERNCAPMPVALFPAAVSAPHLYAIAVMKLYVQHSVGAFLLSPLESPQ